MVIEPFVIDIPAARVEEFRRRLRTAEWPDAVADDWTRGTAPSALQRLVMHAATDFDWSATERRLNAAEHVLVDTTGGRIHAQLAGDAGAPPLLLLHGWPDSFLRFEQLVPLLDGRFRLVIPSIPGYGFSDRPEGVMGPDLIADRMVQLMTALGHERFGVHGGDIGSGVADHLAARHADRVTGVHFANVPISRLAEVPPAELTPDEAAYAGELARWRAAEGGYIAEQSTKPQTIAAALADSPAGLASWFLEKFEAWTDGDALAMHGLDRLAEDVALYWLTGTVASSIRYYYDGPRAGAPGRVTAPVGVAISPHDLVPSPRALGDRFYDIRRWTRFERGGHFAAWEVPELLAAELIAFFDEVDTAR